MLVPQDPRYYDLTNRITESGITLYDLSVWLTLTSVHPFTERLSQQPVSDPLATEMIDKYGEDITLYYLSLDQEKPYFKVHVGTLRTFCYYLGLPMIAAYEGVRENLAKMTKPYDLPSTSRSLDLDECKKVYSQSIKRVKISLRCQIDRLVMICEVLDNDYALVKDYS